MFLRDDILEPIPGDNPGGEDLYYSPLFDKIQAARKQEAENPQAGEEGAAKEADFGKVIELGEEALAVKTKDLRLASWIAEALIYEHAFAGLNEGIKLLHGLIENFWDQGLHPAVEDEEDLEDRAAPLEWFGNYFAPGSRSSPSLAVRMAPLSKSGYGWLSFKESRKIPYEDDQGKGKAEERKEAVEQEKLLPEQFDSDFLATPKPFYKELCAHLSSSRESLPALEKFCDQKFGAQFAPSFGELRKALEEIEIDAKGLLKKKLEQDPDPVAPVALEGAAGEEGESGADARPAGPVLVTLKSSEELAALEPADRSEAVNRILAVAQYLRVQEPQSPVPYLMLRALRWGELRARANGQASGGSESGGQEFEPGFLQAPSAEVRVALRRYAAGSDWRHVLETAERAMGEPCGRGCLDLQRYSIQACEQLGYTAAAAAMLSELRALLKDLPHLTGMTLSDETGAANPATMSWLNEAVLVQQG